MLAGEEGLEPSNAGIKIRCLNQLGDSPKTWACTTTLSIGLGTQTIHQKGWLFDFECFVVLDEAMAFDQTPQTLQSQTPTFLLRVNYAMRIFFQTVETVLSILIFVAQLLLVVRCRCDSE